MSKHTPGPWGQGRLLVTDSTRRYTADQVRRAQYEESKRVFAQFSADDQGRIRIHIATCDNPYDARLIAAAPDLLAFAEMVESRLIAPPYSELRVAARAAIARAKGEKP